MRDIHQQALTRGTVAFLAILLIMCVSVGVGGGVVTAQQSAASSTGTDTDTASAVSVKTTYDSTTPSQRIQVVMTISASDTTLGDVRVKTAGAQKTVIVPNSYQTRGTPGIEVVPQGADEFQIAEVAPGESVTIFFDVMPITLETTTLQATQIDVSYVRNGQQLTTTVTPTADMTQNPWNRQQSLQQQLDNNKTNSMLKTVAAGGGGVFGICGFIAAVWMYSRQRRQAEQFKQNVEEKIEEVAHQIPRPERGRLRTALKPLGIEIPEPESSPNQPTQPQTQTQTQSQSQSRTQDQNQTVSDTDTDTDWSEQLSDD